jgi:hypothetical protein
MLSRAQRVLALLPTVVLAVAGIPGSARAMTECERYPAIAPVTPERLQRGIGADTLVTTIRWLSGADPPPDGSPPLSSRHVSHPDHARAGDALSEALDVSLPDDEGLILSYMRALGFDADGFTGMRTFEVSFGGIDTLDAPTVFLSAHWDSTASNDDGYEPGADPAPGADDDASGVAAALGALRALARFGFEQRVGALFFDGEEEGLLGSWHYVMAESHGPIAALIQLDSVGQDPAGENRLWVVEDARWPELADAVEAAAVELGSPLLLTRVDRDLLGGDTRSDQYPFWESGIPALHLGSFPLPPAYHRATDTVDAIDPAYVEAVAELAAATAARLAVPKEIPGDECGTGCACSHAAGIADPALPIGASIPFLPLLIRRRNR